MAIPNYFRKRTDFKQLRTLRFEINIGPHRTLSTIYDGVFFAKTPS